jgi:ubiquinone/menaquinone biosynthesis C-methylase UbiE
MPFDHFALIAGLYNRMAQFIVPVPLLDLLALPSKGLLLDVGGGTGRVANALRGNVREVVVADISHHMLRYSVNKGLATTCTPAERLPFISSIFDRIIMVDALHHVIDQRQAVDELWRVLAPGGRIVIIEPDIHKFPVKLIAIGEKMLLMRSHFLSAEKISALYANQNARVMILFDDFNVWVCAEKVREL